MNQTLDTLTWKEFDYSKVFVIERGHYNKRPETYGSMHFVSASIYNNGITDMVDSTIVDKVYSGNCITVVNNGYAAEAFYQRDIFTCSHDVNILRIKDRELNVYLAMFLIPIIRSERYRFNYGRKWRYPRMKRSKIMLPTDKNGNPDWRFMEDYIKTTFDMDGLFNRLKALNKMFPMLDLRSRKWREFTYLEIFNIRKGKRIINDEMKRGDIPCIRPIASNNGVHAFIDIKPNQERNTITVNYNGSVGEAFYQPLPHFSLDDINVLYPKFNMNVYSAMFLITLIRMEKYRFSYGRKWDKERMEKSKILLPIDKNGNPDWRFMEDYIKHLHYTKDLSA